MKYLVSNLRALTPLIIFLASITFSHSSAAGLLSISGDTTGQPTFTRPSSGNPPISFGPISPYQSNPFSVDTSGLYDLEVTAASYDTYLILYENFFDPAQSLVNALQADDDGGDGLLSGIFSRSLTAGTNYFAVLAGFGGSSGTYTLEIEGVGEIEGGVPASQIPLPTTLALLGLGLVGLGWSRRKKI